MTHNRIIRSAIGVVWLLVILGGSGVLLSYQSGAGRIGETPQHWPDTSVSLEHGHHTLLMFAHPQCPCTRASIGELNRLMAKGKGNITARVFFLKPPQFGEDWIHSDLWRSAAAIPGVTVQEDPGGREARRFGAETSGYVLLYDPQGELLFKGGITPGRGHAGDNVGASTIVSLLAGGASSLGQTPVYGCSLVDTCEATPKGGIIWKQ